MTVTATDWCKKNEIAQIQYYVKKHNLRWVCNPVLCGDRYHIEYVGTCEDVMAFGADIQSLLDSEKHCEQEFLNARPWWQKISDAIEEFFHGK